MEKLLSGYLPNQQPLRNKMEITTTTQFPYQSQYINVLGSKMHYVDEGEGDPILFIHGMPTWSYLWRNVIPFVKNSGRCIALDLIGFGKSEKPDIKYSVFDHINYLTGFIDALDLQNIVMVLHGWGSVIGFDYAMKHPEKMKGLAFLESYIKPATDWDMLSLPVQEMSTILAGPDGGYDVIMNSNYFVNKVLPSGVLRHLSDEELAYYQEPFANPGDCKPIWQYIQDLPLGDGPKKVIDIIKNYSKALEQSPLPKLFMYAIPGFNTSVSTVEWARDHFKNLKIVDIGEALHYAQESNPRIMGEELAAWLAEIRS